MSTGKAQLLSRLDIISRKDRHLRRQPAINICRSSISLCIIRKAITRPVLVATTSRSKRIVNQSINQDPRRSGNTSTLPLQCIAIHNQIELMMACLSSISHSRHQGPIRSTRTTGRRAICISLRNRCISLSIEVAVLDRCLYLRRLRQVGRSSRSIATISNKHSNITASARA